jgi:DNA-directed RNA polymerase subunit E'/Rpb7
MAMAMDVASESISESNCYSDCMATRKITIPYNEVTNHAAVGKVTEMIRKYISSQIENKCTIEGFVHPNTCKVLSHSSGMLQGPNVVFDVAYKCSVFLPCEGAVLVCRVKSVTGAGILAGINNASVVNPVVVYVLREHHSSESSNSYFNAIKPDSVIRVRVVGRRFELNDTHVSVIGELLNAGIIESDSLKKVTQKQPAAGKATDKAMEPVIEKPMEREQVKRVTQKQPTNENVSNTNFYFEHQHDRASCGRHALNHLVQRKAFTFSKDDETYIDLTVKPPEPVNLQQLCSTMRDIVKHIEGLHDEFVCLKYENHSSSLLMAALSLVNHEMDNPSANKDDIAGMILSGDASASEWKMLVNEDGSSHGGHWTAILKRRDDPNVYYFDSLRTQVKTYNSVEEFVRKFVQSASARTQFAFVRPVREYKNPLLTYAAIQ